MLSDVQIKQLSRQQLTGKWAKLAIMNVCVMAVAGVLGFFLGIIGQILMIPIEIGAISITFHVANSEALDFNKFILNKTQYIRYFVYSILVGVMQMVVSIIGLLLIGGSIIPLFLTGNGSVDAIGEVFTGTSIIMIIVVSIAMIVASIFISLNYFITPYIILMNREDIDGIMAMKYSRKLMRGRKIDLFVLWISFIGWGILSVITFGLGFIFLISYFNTTMANFFFELINSNREDAKEMGIIDDSMKNDYRIFEYDVDVEENYEEEKALPVAEKKEDTVKTDENVSSSEDDNEVKKVNLKKDDASEKNEEQETPETNEEQEDSKKEDPMDALSVEKLTTIEGVEKKEDN